MKLNSLIKTLDCEQSINIIDISTAFGSFVYSGSVADLLLDKPNTTGYKVESVTVCDDLSIDITVTR